MRINYFRLFINLKIEARYLTTTSFTTNLKIQNYAYGSVSRHDI